MLTTEYEDGTIHYNCIVSKADMRARYKTSHRFYTPPLPEPYREKKLAFYKSSKWKQLRYLIISASGRTCSCCGSTGCKIHVDHIVPLSKDWDRRSGPMNLQVLCEDCNMGKGNMDSEDFRSQETIDRILEKNRLLST